MECKEYVYEAVYMLGRCNIPLVGFSNIKVCYKDFECIGVDKSAFKALMRILVVANLASYYEGDFIVTDEQQKQIKTILNEIDNSGSKVHFVEMYNKAIDKFQFFFNNISELEEEIYSRCNYSVTYEMGKELARYIDFSSKKALELGGNSGGLGTAILARYEDCNYTIVDTKVPCMIGNELKKVKNVNIQFVENDVFKLDLPIYSEDKLDYILIVNLLHDFSDDKVVNILKNSLKFCNKKTKFAIIEDVLIDDFQPKDVVMHGLRLSVECRGGKQRTIKEFEDIFMQIGYKLERKENINDVHTLLIMKKETNKNT